MSQMQVISHLGFHNVLGLLLVTIIIKSYHNRSTDAPVTSGSEQRCILTLSYKTCYKEYITQVLQQLHLLSVKQRLLLKVLTSASHYIHPQHQHTLKNYVLSTNHIGHWDHHLTNWNWLWRNNQTNWCKSNKKSECQNVEWSSIETP